MAKQGGQNRRARLSQCALLEEKLKKLKSQLNALRGELRNVPPEDAARPEPAEVIRRRESLRRKRTGLLLEIDETTAALDRAKRPLGGKRVVQGPKDGVRSVVQGGAPGLGRRS